MMSEEVLVSLANSKTVKMLETIVTVNVFGMF